MRRSCGKVPTRVSPVSSTAVQRAERRVLKAVMEPREVESAYVRDAWYCQLCGERWFGEKAQQHDSDCPILALQRARAAARRKGVSHGR